MIFLNKHEKIQLPNKFSNSLNKKNEATLKPDIDQINFLHDKLHLNSLTHKNIMQLQHITGNRATAHLLKNLIGTNNISSQKTIEMKENKTGLPDNLKANIENISGLSMDNVRVHYNSNDPTKLGALAYAKGTDIHVAPGQENHLSHEAWHVVQQAQGRVKSNIQLKGMNVNDNVELEHEADVMGKKASSTNITINNLPNNTQLFTGNENVAQLAKPHNKLKKGAPISQTHKTLTHIPPKKYYYKQSTDPSCRPFLNGRGIMGEKAVIKQLRHEIPLAEDVRVLAQKGIFQRRGAGLHEALPTNRRDFIARRANNRILAGLQSGLRTACDRTALKLPSKALNAPPQVALHTGMAPKLSGAGSTHTKGQAEAHDLLRQFPDESKSRAAQVVSSAAHLTKVLASGQDIVKSPSITGALPNIVGFNPIEPIQPASVGKERAKLAAILHQEREHMKDRIISYADANGIPRCVSPQREMMDEHGRGGDYIPLGVPPRPCSPVPIFDCKPDSVELPAHEAAWMSAPTRHEFTSIIANKECPNCKRKNWDFNVFCDECGAKL